MLELDIVKTDTLLSTLSLEGECCGVGWGALCFGGSGGGDVAGESGTEPDCFLLKTCDAS